MAPSTPPTTRSPARSSAGSSTTPIGRCAGWLHGIVTHAALDALRRRRVRQLALPVLGRIGELDLVRAGLGSDPAVEVVRRRVVDEGLAALRPEARAAVVLRHYYGYDYAEIAGFLRTSPGNVGSILSRAHAPAPGAPLARGLPGRSVEQGRDDQGDPIRTRGARPGDERALNATEVLR